MLLLSIACTPDAPVPDPPGVQPWEPAEPQSEWQEDVFSEPADSYALSQVPVIDPWRVEVSLTFFEEAAQVVVAIPSCLVADQLEAPECAATYDPGRNAIVLIDDDLGPEEELHVFYAVRDVSNR